MAIEVKKSGTVFTGRGVEAFALRSYIGRLNLEALGLKSRVPTLKLVKAKYNLTGNREAVIKALEAKLKAILDAETITVDAEVSNG